MTTPQSGSQSVSRRSLLAAGVASAAAASFAAPTTAAEPSAKPAAKYSAERPIRIGVISAAIEGAGQRLNGHTWQFCQPFHADMDLDAVSKITTPQMAKAYAKWLRL